jgi:hypothetical protein
MSFDACFRHHKLYQREIQERSILLPVSGYPSRRADLLLTETEKLKNNLVNGFSSIYDLFDGPQYSDFLEFDENLGPDFVKCLNLIQ